MTIGSNRKKFRRLAEAHLLGYGFALEAREGGKKYEKTLANGFVHAVEFIPIDDCFEGDAWWEIPFQHVNMAPFRGRTAFDDIVDGYAKMYLEDRLFESMVERFQENLPQILDFFATKRSTRRQIFDEIVSGESPFETGLRQTRKLAEADFLFEFGRRQEALVLLRESIVEGRSRQEKEEWRKGFVTMAEEFLRKIEASALNNEKEG